MTVIKEQWLQIFEAEMKKVYEWDIRHIDEDALYERFRRSHLGDSAALLAEEMHWEWERLHGI